LLKLKFFFQEKKFTEQSELKHDSVFEISAIQSSSKPFEIDNKVLKKKKMKTSNINGSLSNKKRTSIQKSETLYVQSNIPPTTTHMVPIQTFSFLKWSINVDTLVRLFIIA
jgi:hypothetical protein